MSNLSLPELIFLVGVIVAFGGFGLTLLGVSVWTTLGRPTDPTVEREVTPARHVGADR